MKIKVVSYKVKDREYYEYACNKLIKGGWTLESQQTLASSGKFVLVAFFRFWEVDDETV